MVSIRSSVDCSWRLVSYSEFLYLSQLTSHAHTHAHTFVIGMGSCVFFSSSSHPDLMLWRLPWKQQEGQRLSSCTLTEEPTVSYVSSEHCYQKPEASWEKSEARKEDGGQKVSQCDWLDMQMVFTVDSQNELNDKSRLLKKKIHRGFNKKSNLSQVFFSLSILNGKTLMSVFCFRELRMRTSRWLQQPLQATELRRRTRMYNIAALTLCQECTHTQTSGNSHTLERSHLWLSVSWTCWNTWSFYTSRSAPGWMWSRKS